MLVYTAISGRYDLLRPVAAYGQPGSTFVAFLDEQPAVPPWEARELVHRSGDSVRDAKRYKIIPQEFFPDTEYSLWIDGKIELTVKFPIARMAEFLRDVDVAVFEHPLRCCLYQEACQCIHRQLDDPHIIYQQVQRYTQAGFPANLGLVDCAVLLRRHTPRMFEFSKLWWEEIQMGSRRDQLSFTYCAWKHQMKYRLLPGFTHANRFFKCHTHAKARPDGNLCPGD